MTREGVRHRGYTIVELMMAIAVMAIGVTGIIAMQKVTVTANQHAKHLSVATQIASAWLDVLAVDALRWNKPNSAGGASDLNETQWLNNVTGTWFRPAPEATQLLFGPGFDGLGNPLLNETALGSAVYCTHLRLNWLVPEVTNVTGNGLIRAEVRVFWRREGAPDSMCATATNPDGDVSEKPELYHFVYQTGAIRQNAL